jgi:K+-transporting ATPase ATPase A chain
MLLFNAIGMFLLYALLRFQSVLPLNPQQLAAPSADLSLNTAISFVTNTNWQSYSGETSLSYMSQMLGLTVQNFVSAATGMAVLAALIRSFVRQETRAIGNFWTDLVKGTLYVLLPMSLVLSLVLCWQGAVQTFSPYASYSTLESSANSTESAATAQSAPTTTTQSATATTTQSTPAATTQSAPAATTQSAPAATTSPAETAATQSPPGATTVPAPTATTQPAPPETTQQAPIATIPALTTIALGPAESQIAIKQLGTNGGGFFNANSAHPFENPTPFTNFLEMLAILIIPAALCHTFGKMVSDSRQGWALFITMTVIFAAFLTICCSSELSVNPLLTQLGVNSSATQSPTFGNMEGKELRFGLINSALWATVTTAASNGSVNAMHDSFNPLGGLVPMVMMQLGEVIFGGVGSGLYGMLVFAIITVFISGLMVGRTPEYLGKKIEAL